MKSASAAITAHLNREVTTLTTCWRIVRTDGAVFAFTAHDQDITIGDVVYDSKNGFSRTAISASSDLSVDNLDVTGVISSNDIDGIIDSDSITNEDLRNGLFNFASIYMFITDWNNPVADDIKLRRGWFGEVTLSQNGMFVSEVRGMTQAFSHNYIEVFTPDCRADFCDPKCGLKIADFSISATVFSVEGTSFTKFTASTFPDITLGTSLGAHRYWRMATRGIESTTNWAGFAEMQFFDQTGALITGGTANASSASKHHSAMMARDGLASTHWATKDDQVLEQTWWEADFGTPKDVKEWTLQTANEPSETPTSFDMQWSDDGYNYTFAKSCTAVWTKAGQIALWSIGSPTDDPLNYPDAIIGVGEPFVGASTYIGGTVTFISGRNAKRTIEIIDYDADTHVITLFDGTAYPILAGDTITITQGCDKMRATCSLYGNMINFRGEPDVPGQDTYLSHPDAQS